MPSHLRTEPIHTLREFTDLIEKVAGEGTSTCWYRGCGKSTYTLTPRLYRHPAVHELSDLVRIEATIMARFKERSVPYLTRDLPNDWEVLFLMQHHGVPTRLLDWTENPFIALYFAVTAAPQLFGVGGPEFLEDAAVWLLNPIAWNRHVLQHVSYAGDILSPADPLLSGYAPVPKGPTNNEAVAMFGIYNSPRIVAQRGVFTIFGVNTHPMETVYAEGAFPDESLMKVTLPKDSLMGLTRSLSSIGITDSVVWPDLDGLATEIKRQSGYEV